MAKEEKKTFKEEMSHVSHHDRPEQETVKTPAIKPPEQEPSPEVPSSPEQEPLTPATFAAALEALMNEAIQESQVESDHQHHWASWANGIGDVWREVKQHA